MTANSTQNDHKKEPQVGKTSMEEPRVFSNPATPTTFRWNRVKKRSFFNIINPLTDNIDSNKGRKPLINKNGFPYRPAKLVYHNQRPTIQFYVWDITDKKLKRRRVCAGELGSFTNEKRMLEYAADTIAEINGELEYGGYQQSEIRTEKIKPFSFGSYTLASAIDYVMKRKLEVEGLKKGTMKEYAAFKKSLLRYLKYANLNASIKLEQITASFVNGYLIYLKEVEAIGNKTHNNRLSSFNSVVNTLMALDYDLFKKTGSPLRNARRLKPGATKKHAAYTDLQMTALRERMIANGDAHLWTYIQFIFYTLARPNELRHLKVGHIAMDRRQILISGASAKTNIEEYVGISDAFAQVITDSGILSYAPDLYVFSNRHTIPGESPAGVNYYYKQIRPYLKEYRKVNPNYDTYGFKHTGAISLYLATKDLYTVQRQCRHTTMSQTEKYLRDLGIFSGFDNLKHWKGV